MNSLWEKEFVPLEMETPQDIIENQCSLLNKQTNGQVIAKITEYHGPITSYIKKGFSSLSTIFADKEVNIQDELGDVSEGDFTFEVFITSASTPNYKYRIMFIQFGIEFYPVKIVLDETIATELNKETQIECNNQNEFETLLKGILNSKKLEKVISALLSITYKDEIPFD